MGQNPKQQEPKTQTAPETARNFSLPLIVYLACTIFANNCRSFAFQEGDEASGEMSTVLFMIILVSLNTSLRRPRLYLMTFVSLSARADGAAGAENTSRVLGTPFTREPLAHGLGGSSLAPSSLPACPAHPVCTFCTFQAGICLHNPGCPAFLSPHR